MQNIFSPSRRRLLGATAAALTASDVFAVDSDGNGAGVLRKYSSATNKTGAARMFGPIHQVDAGVLNIGYAELGPSGGAPVFLLHGWPYDIHSYWEVATQLADRGCRVIVPHLRGHGTTRFLDQSVPRSGQQAALGADVIALMDALGIPKATLAGYDWGGRAACVAAALWPERCAGLVSVNSYLIQDIANASRPPSSRDRSRVLVPVLFLNRARPGGSGSQPQGDCEAHVDAKLSALAIP